MQSCNFLIWFFFSDILIPIERGTELRGILILLLKSRSYIWIWMFLLYDKMIQWEIGSVLEKTTHPMKDMCERREERIRPTEYGIALCSIKIE